MVGSIGAQIGLLAFATALLAGLAAGNSLTVVLTRALVALLGGAVVGQFAGWAAKTILREYLQRRKHDIDTAHFAASQALLDEGQFDSTDASAPQGE